MATRLEGLRTEGQLGEYDCYALNVDEQVYLDLFTGEEKQKFETPLDRWGVVDQQALLRETLLTTPRSHYWGFQKRDHHYQWPFDLYPYLPLAQVNPRSFRELPTNKEKLPLSFERRLHIVSLFPPRPSDEVMSQKIEAYHAANMLFRRAREIIQWQKHVRHYRLFNTTDNFAARHNDPNRNEIRSYNKSRGHRLGRGFGASISRYYDVPPEFRIVETGGSAEQVAFDLGKALGAKALKQVIAAT